MSFRAVAIAALLIGPQPASASARGYWLQAAPKDSSEVALREALVSAAFAGPEKTAEGLLEVSLERPGSVVSGLARLAAGLQLLDAGRPAEALPLLRHPDVRQTALVDHALLAVGLAFEASAEPASAAQAYLDAVAAAPGGPLACAALFRAAEAWSKADRPDAASEPLQRALASCPGQEARALLDIAEAYGARKDTKAAAAVYDRLDREYPASPQAREASRRLAALSSLRPAETPEVRVARALAKALALFQADRYSEAVLVLRALKAAKLEAEERDLVRVRLGRAYLALNRTREAESELAALAPESPHGAEAAFHRAKIAAQRRRSIEQYEAVAVLFRGTSWGEEALFSLANHFQKDARDDEALPYYRRLLEGYPDGRYVDRAGWRVGWGDYRAGRYADAAQSFERVARLRPASSFTPGLLYWAGRARRETGEAERARQLLEETVRRYKNAYHGMRAHEVLARLPGERSPEPPVLVARLADPGSEIPEPQLTRLRQLFLIDRLEEASEELKTVPPSPIAQATLAWIEWRRGHLRPAIVAMKRAYPEYLSQGGDRLPPEVWRILFPLDFGDVMQAKAAEQGLDPALVAALICQESTFNAGAVSAAGARGLMQVVPRTGRTLARALKMRYTTGALHDPAVSLTFGTHYLRQLLDRFGGRVERALAAYNAGPHRVDAWTAGRPDVAEEEFIESIPFSETRYYVMAVLAGRQQYRRIYGFPEPSRAADAAAKAP